MAWPPSVSSLPVLGQKANLTTATIRWGTAGIYPNDAYIVVSATPADEVEPIYIENGSGVKSIRILIWQGRKFNITVIDDSTVAPPLIGTVIYLYDPLSITNIGASATNTMKFTVIDNSYNAARKEPGQRVIVAEYLTNIEGNGSVPLGV